MMPSSRQESVALLAGGYYEAAVTEESRIVSRSRFGEDLSAGQRRQMAVDWIVQLHFFRDAASQSTDEASRIVVPSGLSDRHVD